MMGNYETNDAWAVVFEGETQVATVSKTQRAATVNWLVVHHNIMILNRHTDQDITQMWQKHSGEARVVPVKIHRQILTGDNDGR